MVQELYTIDGQRVQTGECVYVLEIQNGHYSPERVIITKDNFKYMEGSIMYKNQLLCAKECDRKNGTYELDAMEPICLHATRLDIIRGSGYRYGIPMWKCHDCKQPIQAS